MSLDEIESLVGIKPFHKESSGILWNCDCMDVMRKLPDKCIDLCLCDPPYGIGEDGGKCRTRGKSIPNHEKGNWDNERPKKEYFDEILRISKNQIIFGGNYFTDYLSVSRGWIYWDKEMGGDFSDGELAWTSFDMVLKSFKKCTRFSGKSHPTQKPIELMRWCLEKYSEAGMTVFDPFLGSGTTALAARDLGRKFIGCEKEEKYCLIAKKRLENSTPPLFSCEPLTVVPKQSSIEL